MSYVHAYANRKGKRHRPKIRAHANPLAVTPMDHPVSPDQQDWASLYPAYFSGEDGNVGDKKVTIADVGCGYGDLIFALAELFPEELVLGLEIRESVVEIVREKVRKRREAALAKANGDGPAPLQNSAVVLTNIMKHAANWFEKNQLNKIFFCFPDPHFKKALHRRRVIGPAYLDVYAYTLRVGGLAYTITDVPDLHAWMVKHFVEHPLFEQLDESEWKDDPCIEAMRQTNEGQKVTAHGGMKLIAVFRRLA